MRTIAELLQRRGGTARDVALLMHFSTLACEARAEYNSESFATISTARAASVASAEPASAETVGTEAAEDRSNQFALGIAGAAFQGAQRDIDMQSNVTPLVYYESKRLSFLFTTLSYHFVAEGCAFTRFTRRRTITSGRARSSRCSTARA